MAKLSLEELRAVRKVEMERLKKRDIHGKSCHIVVAMGTKGIEAGAKITLNALVDEAEAKGLDKVIITQTGSMEGDNPIVEVHTPELGTVAYGKVDAKTAKAIIDEHVIGGKILKDHQITVED